MRKAVGKTAFSVLLCILIAACGRVVDETVRKTVHRHGEIGADTAGERELVYIRDVKNATGEPRYDRVRHFLHLKSAEFLTNTGDYAVVADSGLEENRTRGDETTPRTDPEKTQWDFSVDLTTVCEDYGPTLATGVFSSQKKHVRVSLKADLTDRSTGKMYTTKATGSSTRAAWGFFARVERDAMTEDRGVWDVGESIVGQAACNALSKAVHALQKQRSVQGKSEPDF